MANLNKVFLIGNLTRDPQLRYTPSGSPVADLGMAVNRKYKAQDGTWKDEVCYVNLTAWGKTAENAAEYLAKGRSIFVEGRLRFDQWEAKSGEKRSRLLVVVERLQFLGARPPGAEGGRGPARAEKAPEGEAEPGPPDDEPEVGPPDDNIPF
jgi:single-strand DNA-binding protein